MRFAAVDEPPVFVLNEEDEARQDECEPSENDGDRHASRLRRRSREKNVVMSRMTKNTEWDRPNDRAWIGLPRFERAYGAGDPLDSVWYGLSAGGKLPDGSGEPSRWRGISRGSPGTKVSLEADESAEHAAGKDTVFAMFLRLLLLLFKSAVMVALLELLNPVADAIGLQFRFVDTVASAIAHSTAIPYRDAETLFLFGLVTAVLEGGQWLWDLVTG